MCLVYAIKSSISDRIYIGQTENFDRRLVAHNTGKDELLVEYATYEMNSLLFVQKYQLYLPDREELRHELEITLREASEEAEEV